jgi:16S rRNA processing protein RimM
MDLPFPDDAVEVGRIAGAWGVKGWIRVQPFSLDPQALFSTKRWFLQAPSGASAVTLAACASHPVLKLIHAKEHGDAVVASVQGLEGRDAAEALRGARVYVSRASFPSAAEGEYYWVDLIGLTVVNRQGAVLGEVVGLMETGTHDVLRVQPPGGGVTQPQECLIPFVAVYVDGVDLARRRITVDWGLDY